MTRILTIFLLLLLTLTVNAQPHLRFRHLSLLEGLSQSTVNCVIQDRDGFMWIGTQDGLNRYDGYSFKVFKHSQKDTNTIPDNYIQSLYLDKYGKIWIGTYGAGLSEYDPVTNRFRNFKHNESDYTSLSNNLVMSVTEDIDGNLWVATSDGLNRFDRKSEKFKRYFPDENSQSSISSNKIRCLFLDSKKNLWIGTANKGLNLYMPENDSFQRFTADGKDGSISHDFVQTITENSKGELLIGTSGGGVNLLDPQTKIFKQVSYFDKSNDIHIKDVWSVNEDKNGIIWIGTYGSGLMGFNPQTGNAVQFKNDITDLSSLSNNILLCSFVDKQGFIWVGTLGGGLSYFHPHGTPFKNIYHQASTQNSLNENVVMSILETDYKSLLIGTYGGGLNVYDKKDKHFSFFVNTKSKNSIPSNIVRSIFQDSDKRIWIGSYDGGLSEYRNGSFINHIHDSKNPQSISSNDVWCIKESNDGILWIGTWGGGLNKLDKSSGKFTSFRNSSDPSSLSNDKVISLLIDSQDRIWVGTNGGGLNLFDRKTEKFTHFRHNKDDSSSISSDRIRSIYQDRHGHIWVGTDGGGLNRMNANGTFINFRENEGLPNNVVYGILEDNEDHLWLSTNNGLCRFSIKDYSTRNFDITDGIQGNEFNQGAYFKSKDGEMYFGGTNGITHFNPVDIRSNQYVPPIVLTSVKLFGKDLVSDTSASSIRELRFSYDQNFFSFEFSALDFTAPEKNQYACKMEGFDQDWIFLGNKRFVSYTNLDPGEYTFRVIASNNENVWNNEGYSLKIIITPPFYKTGLFYILMIIMAIAAVYLFIYLRTRNLRLAKKALEEEVSIRTKEVVQQKEIIEGKNKDITDSINYARRIQRAIFPSTQSFSTAFPDSFIFYKPKDIVSGDFYWMERYGDDHFVAVVDCTGHGVPGAFMSIVGNNLLNQSVNELGISKPSLILNEMNKGLAKLVRNQDNFDFKDGMDMALCAVNMKNGTLQFSGANNPVWIIRNESNKTIEEYKGDKRPIGSFNKGEGALFTNHEITLRKGDSFYLFSDGFADQFGGSEGKKMKKSRLKELLLSINDLPMKQQGKAVDEFFNKWQGNYEQVDDVLIIGIRY